MTIQGSADQDKKHFDEYLAQFEACEVEKDVKGMRRNLKRAIEYWEKYTEKAASPTIQMSRMDNLETLISLYESLPEDGEVLVTVDGEVVAAKKGGQGKDDDEASKFGAVERPTLRFKDIAGLNKVKEEIKLKMLYPCQHPEEAKKFRIKRGGGVLLWGPPGTGKTMMAKAIAGEIDAAFFTVKPSEIMRKWVGDSEQNIQALFDTARAEPISIIFIDEIEALVPARKDGDSNNVMARLVPQILTELAGFEDNQNPLLFIGATNEPWSLDPAILRPGRFDVKIYVGLPDVAAREKLLEIGFKGRPMAPDVDFKALAQRLEGFSGADINYVCENAAQDAFKRAIFKAEDNPKISMIDVGNSIDETKPSVTDENLKRFKDYQHEI
ncbi:MAG: ATP-binding protein [Planctomycetota bacterium]|nr:ATP-binding protein [Planctomycetota bacterium]